MFKGPDGQKKIIQPEAEYKIISPEKTIEVVKSLNQSLKAKNSDEIREYLRQLDNWENIIPRRMKQGENFQILESSFAFLIEKELSKLTYLNQGEKATIFNVKAKDIIDWLHDTGLPEEILNKIQTTAYHARNDRLFFRLYNIITENEQLINNKNVLIKAVNDFAAWRSSADKAPDKKQAKRINEGIIAKERSRKIQVNPVILNKAKYGAIYNDPTIKPRQRAELFKKIQSGFENLGDEFDALQSMNETALAYFDLAKRQRKMGVKEKTNSEENLALAKNLALATLSKAIELKYTNAEIRARETLGKIYDYIGDSKKAKSYGKKADEMREVYKYYTK